MPHSRGVEPPRTWLALVGLVSIGGGTDKFRIKIWDKASSQVVYDNQLGVDETADPNTVLGRGSIVIHKE